MDGGCEREESGKPEGDGFGRLAGTVFLIQDMGWEEKGGVDDIWECGGKGEEVECFEKVEVGGDGGERDG